MQKRIFIINGNPGDDSLCHQLATHYQAGAHLQADTKIIHLSNMSFDANLRDGYRSSQTLEPCLQEFQQTLTWADHIVMVSPIWWGSIPAKLKGLIDRTFLPGFAFEFHEGKTWPDQLLKDKTATLIFTLDTPPWYYRFIQGEPAVKQIKITTLKYCGIETVTTKLLGSVINSNEKTRKKWLEQVKALGATQK